VLPEAAPPACAAALVARRRRYCRVAHTAGSSAMPGSGTQMVGRSSLRVDNHWMRWGEFYIANQTNNHKTWRGGGSEKSCACQNYDLTCHRARAADVDEQFQYLVFCLQAAR